jgi:hypothetical protein
MKRDGRICTAEGAENTEKKKEEEPNRKGL